jgi:Ni/Co efflux regulator RcnB
MKSILIGAAALSVLASAGLANAQPYEPRQSDRHEQGRDHQDERYDRAQHRYSAGRYQPPRGYEARQWRPGERLPAAYRSRAYVVDHRAYGLRAPPRGYQYVRVNNDVVMTAVATGLITSVIASLFQ